MEENVRLVLDTYMPSSNNEYIASLVTAGLAHYEVKDLSAHLFHLNRSAPMNSVLAAVDEILALRLINIAA